MSAHRILDDLFVSDFEGIDPGDAGVITAKRDRQVFGITTGASAETRTVAAPGRAGLLLSLVMVTDGGGDVVITLPTGFNQALNSTVTMGDAQDFVLFQSVQTSSGTFKWRLLVNDGTTLG